MGETFLRGDAAVYVKPGAVAETRADELCEREATHWLQCLHCNNNVAKTSDRIVVDGKHDYSFINPVGVIYRIGCFGSAPGAVAVGEASGEFTWFAGHKWRVVLCLGCGRHLGWEFDAGESRPHSGRLLASFFGLILAELKQAA
jgi:hypothetical protein